jgi:hypothetical protein
MKCQYALTIKAISVVIFCILKKVVGDFAKYKSHYIIFQKINGKEGGFRGSSHRADHKHTHPPRRNVKKRFQSIVFLPMDSPFTTLHKRKDP